MRESEEDVTDEEMAFVNGAAVDREGRTGDGEVGAQSVHQGFGDRTDVALWC